MVTLNRVKSSLKAVETKAVDVGYLHYLWKEGKLRLSTEHGIGRTYTWNEEKVSMWLRTLESHISNLGSIITAVLPDNGVEYVIDGNNRLTTAFNCLEGKVKCDREAVSKAPMVIIRIIMGANDYSAIAYVFYVINRIHTPVAEEDFALALAPLSPCAALAKELKERLPGVHRSSGLAVRLVATYISGVPHYSIPSAVSTVVENCTGNLDGFWKAFDAVADMVLARSPPTKIIDTFHAYMVLGKDTMRRLMDTKVWPLVLFILSRPRDIIVLGSRKIFKKVGDRGLSRIISAELEKAGCEMTSRKPSKVYRCEKRRAVEAVMAAYERYMERARLLGRNVS